MGRLLRNSLTAAACVVVLTVVTGLTALADIDQPSQNPTTGHKGAPNQTCQTFTVTPGKAANAPGSPFNPNGNAGLHYAGNPNTSSLAHSNSTASVAQYDNACVRLSSH
jgi:hypothetical protein